MRRLFASFVSVLALAAQVPMAQAQDAPAYDPPSYNGPSYDAGSSGYTASTSKNSPPINWAGRYIGITAGRGLAQVEQSDPTGASSGKTDLPGLVFGGTMGTNWQYSSLVVGIESDVSISQMTGEFQIPTATWGCNTPTSGCTTDVGWFATTRGRAGIAFDRFLPFITAGGALAGVETKYSGSALVENNSGLAYGWVVGAGLEVALSDHFTVKGEALYVDLGNSMSLLSSSKFKTDTNFSAVRLGANFKF